MESSDLATYRKSVARVDVALARLNATLEAYRLSGAKSVSNTTKPPSEVAGIEGHEFATALAQGGQLDSDAATVPEGMIIPQSKVENPLWQEVLDLHQDQNWQDTKTASGQSEAIIHAIRGIHGLLDEHAYAPPVYILLAQKYFQLGFPDLAAGAAYKALLLIDAARDSMDEYYVQASTALRLIIAQQILPERITMLKRELHADITASGRCITEGRDLEMDIWIRGHYLGLIYHILVRSLTLCGCLSSAGGYVPDLEKHCRNNNNKAMSCISDLHAEVAKYYRVKDFSSIPPNSRLHTSWPVDGHARRELYPWNDFEPDRYSGHDELNRRMREVAPKLEIRAVQLPALTTGDADAPSVTQLGVFAREDIEPGESILTETSILTANNKLQDALCDACSADLPDLSSTSTAVQCADCEAVFCSATCFDLANETYHPAVCGTHAETISKNVPSEEGADALYALLLFRALAMAETQDLHPLDLKEVKYIWGDFSPASSSTSPAAAHPPSRLPFNFVKNVVLPIHMLEKMNIDVFAQTDRYDTWVFNTLYAKFRGTASARLSGLGGRPARGPEVCAVHPMWCMANHSCDPNVSWEWGGSITFTAREERVDWRREAKDGTVETQRRKQAGIRKGEEILNHYCDIGLSVKDRREWARGALGGDCRCERCVYEAGEVKAA